MLDHLKKLSKIKTNAGIKFLTPAAFPGNHCPMHTALALSSRIEGMSTLLVGTPECGNYSRGIIENTKDTKELYLTYILDSHEVVFGCRKGLIETIRKMDKLSVKAISIILTCVPEIIGEDIEGIIYEIQPEVNAILTYVNIGHFKCNSYPSGYYKTLLSFKAFMKKAITNKKVVNVLGRGPKEDHIPMPKVLDILEKKGIELKMLAPKSSINDFIEAPKSALNIVVSPFMEPLAKMMEDEFNIPYIDAHKTYSVNDIDNLYTSIEEILEIKCKEDLSDLKEKTISLENKAKNILSNKSYVLTNLGAVAPLPLVLYLSEFNMKPLVLHIDEFYPNDKKLVKLINEKGYDPLASHMVNDEIDSKVLKELNADIYLGILTYKLEECSSVPHLENLYGSIGYERSIELLSRFIKTVDKEEI